jgi:hypothetical protein
VIWKLAGVADANNVAVLESMVNGGEVNLPDRRPNRPN